MLVEIYTVVKNGEYYLPLYLKHYQTSFPGCIINIYNNNSTDTTVKLCREAGCIIYPFPVYTEFLLQDFKNNIWKSSKAQWIIICDVDELAQVTYLDLEKLGNTNILKFEGYNMIEKENKGKLELYKFGYPSIPYNKAAMFKKSVKEINYALGAHTCKPVNPIYSKGKYKLLHYKKVWANFKNFSEHITVPSVLLQFKKTFENNLKNAIKVK